MATITLEPGKTTTLQVTLVPIAPVDNPAVAVGLATILSKLITVYGYKVGEGVAGWTIYRPDWAATYPDRNTLTTLYKGRTYDIKVSQNCTLIYSGYSYALIAEWNQITWLAPAAFASLEGSVVNSATGAAISGATVTIVQTAPYAGAPVSTTTNASGYFSLANLTVGDYTGTIQATGYITATF